MPRKNSLYRAVFETPHFHFESYGKEKDEAVSRLRQAWKIHCEQMGARLSYIDENASDIQVQEVFSGSVYRDAEEILSHE